MLRTSLALYGVVVLACSCGPDIRTFDVTVRTVRSCRPAGIIPQLCEDPSEFAGKTRTATYMLETTAPHDFILYDEGGRALPGTIQRGFYFARALTTQVTSDGCAKTAERSVRFELLVDRLPWVPRVRDRSPTRIRGNSQDRAFQNEACGQPSQSKLEETFEGEETTPDAVEGFRAGLPQQLRELP